MYITNIEFVTSPQRTQPRMFIVLRESLHAASGRAVTVPRIGNCAGESVEEGETFWIKQRGGPRDIEVRVVLIALYQEYFNGDVVTAFRIHAGYTTDYS